MMTPMSTSKTDRAKYIGLLFGAFFLGAVGLARATRKMARATRKRVPTKNQILERDAQALGLQLAPNDIGAGVIVAIPWEGAEPTRVPAELEPIDIRKTLTRSAADAETNLGMTTRRVIVASMPKRPASAIVRTCLSTSYDGGPDWHRQMRTSRIRKNAYAHAWKVRTDSDGNATVKDRGAIGPCPDGFSRRTADLGRIGSVELLVVAGSIVLDVTISAHPFVEKNSTTMQAGIWTVDAQGAIVWTV